MKECSCKLFFKKKFSLATCKMILLFGHEKFRLGPAHLGGFSTGMVPHVINNIFDRLMDCQIFFLESKHLCCLLQVDSD